jgi:hypothetical protein
MSRRSAEIEMRTLDQRNTWPLPSGELAVRPGLRQVATFTGTAVAGATFRVPTTDDPWHYIVTVEETAGGANTVRLVTLDRDLVSRQVLVIGTGRAPRDVSFSEALGNLIISSPDFPTLAGYVGGGVYFAAPVASGSGQPELRIPQGLSASWAGRVAITEGAGLYISDPVSITGGSPLTYVGRNAQWRPGVIYGLHVAAGGSLVACTPSGVFSLPPSAASSGQVAIPNWTQISTHATTGYGQTCVAAGRVYGLTQGGLRLIDTEDAPDIPLSERVVPRAIAPRVARQDWRNGRMVSLEEGPAVTAKLLGDPFCKITPEFRSWWTPAPGVTTGDLVGALTKPDGEELLLFGEGVYRVVGDFDGTATLSSEGLAVQGWCVGAVQPSPQQSLTAIDITVGAEYNAADVVCTLRGVDGSNDDDRANPQFDFNGVSYGVLIDGTNAWDDGRRLQERPLSSRRAQFKLRDDDFGFEVGATHGQTRLAPLCRILFDGIDDERPIG